MYQSYILRVKQGAVAQLAWTIGDLGALGGIIVTPIGVQRGGKLIGKRAGIQTVQLDADSTTTGYLLKFLGSVVAGPRGARLTVTGGVPDVTGGSTKLNE